MTEREFKSVYKKAVKKEYPDTQEFRQQAAMSLMGFGHTKCICTKAQAAYILNYQALMLNGVYEAEALGDTHIGYKQNVKLID